MPRWSRVALALLAVMPATGCRAAQPTAAPRTAKAPIRHVLPNGVPVIIEEHRASDVVALQLWVRAGGRDETASELGLAHYLEHMLFKGTAARPGGFIEREVEGVGGRMNAATSWDYTFYHVVLPARQAAAGIELLADIAVNASLDATTLEAEKQVVLEEMRLYEDAPRRFLGERLYAQTFAAHPYGRPLAGTPELVRGLTRDTLMAFYRRHYVPEAFTLVVVGAVDTEAMLAKARATIGRLPRSGTQPLPPPPLIPHAARKVEITRPGGSAYLGLAWAGPRIDHGDTPALDLMMTILGGGRTSRLVQTLRERRGTVNAVDAGFSSLQGASLLTVTAQAEPDRVAAAEREILDEIRRLREDGVTEAERRRAVTAAEAQHEFATETAEGRARALGRAETTWRLEDELLYVDRLRSVSLEQIRGAARRYLDPERYTRVALVPPPAGR